MVMINLQKSFDTVNHDILLKKLKVICLDDFSKSWFSLYLKNIFHKTEVDGIFPDLMVVFAGIHLGTNTIPNLCKRYGGSCIIQINADDSALLVSGRSVSVIEETL